MASKEYKLMKLTSDLRDSGIEVESKLPDCPLNTQRILNEFLTQDEDLMILKRRVMKLSLSEIPVLITGETGVGKELIARALHGDRRGRFVGVNCGGIPDTLLESEFFGCEPGAFTGAIKRRGYFQEADNGTLFLDEIGELPSLLQCKLLRVLQERRLRPVGSTQEISVICRIVSATNREIGKLKDSGEFRLDLFYRLAATIIHIKPLRERINDLRLLLSRHGISEDAFDEEREWRGN